MKFNGTVEIPKSVILDAVTAHLSSHATDAKAVKVTFVDCAGHDYEDGIEVQCDITYKGTKK